MTIIKNGCICGGDYYTTTEQCDDIECNSKRKNNIMTEEKYKIGFNLLMEYWDSFPDERKEEINDKLKEIGL